MTERLHPAAVLMLVMGATTVLATSLHGIEAGIWASAYRLLGALSDPRSAMLHSLSAITSYGHPNLVLEERWQLMGVSLSFEHRSDALPMSYRRRSCAATDFVTTLCLDCRSNSGGSWSV
jgi:hypothetical protein